MRKFIILFISAILSICTMSAKSVVEPRFVDNTYIGVTTGVSTMVDGWENNTVSGLRIGKMVTPTLGFEVIGKAYFRDFYKTILNSRVGVNTMFNINGLWFNGTRPTVEFTPFVGFGWQADYRPIYHDNVYTTMGVYVDWNLTDRFYLTIAPQVGYVLTGTHLEYNVNRMDIGIEIGAAYRFGNYFKICDKVYTQAEYNRLNDEVTRLRELSARVDTVEVEVIREVVRKVNNTAFVYPTIGFKHNSSEIVETNQASIVQLANIMNASDKTYTIYGYASEEGTDEVNNRLSQERADAIRNALIEAGVDANRIKAVGEGATTQFGTKHEYNRIVIINE